MGTLLQTTTNQGVTFPGGHLSDGYKKIKLPATRIVGSDMVDIAMRTHYVKGLLELDVTDARRTIKEKSSEGTRVSFTAWIIKCLAIASSEYPEVNSFRKGRSL